MDNISPNRVVLEKGRKKRKLPKTKSGCITCKWRRVKCDEGKPECTRCKKFGVDCDGYLGVTPKRSHPQRSLLPLQISNNLSVVPFTGVQCQNEFELKHFRNFQADIALDLSGLCEKIFWNRLVMQGCRRDRFVLSAVVAISAMSVSVKLIKDAKDETSLGTAIRHRELALEQHEKSLQAMREALSKNGDTACALTACLLVCFFESLSGNILTTINHARSGQKLLRECLISESACLRAPCTDSPLQDLMEVGDFLNTQILGFSDVIPAEFHQMPRKESDEMISLMPKKFLDIDKARLYAGLVFSRAEQFMREICPEQRAQSLAQVLENKAIISIHDKNYRLDPPIHFFTLSDGGLALKSEKDMYEQEHLRWRAAFKPLYNKIIRSSDKSAEIAAHTHFIRCKLSGMWLISALDTDNCSFDRYLIDFQEIVNASRRLIWMKKETPNTDFTFNFCVIPALHVVGRLCRDRLVRREAIELLRTYSCREGTWDSSVVAELSSRVIELEEYGIETNYIPKQARIRSVRITVNSQALDSEKALMLAFVRGPAAENNLEEIAYMRWPENLGNMQNEEMS